MRYSGLSFVRCPAKLILFFTAVTSVFLLVTCSDDSPVNTKRTEPTVRLVSKTSCKTYEGMPLSESASICTQDCLHIWSDSNSTLRVRHINAAFNCCMESLTVTIEIKGDVALITESDHMENGGCKCLCIYDAEYEISNLPATVSKIEIVEPYAKLDQWPEEIPLCCSLVQPVLDTSHCCVDRCHYPWGITIFPEITVVGMSECKTDTTINPVYPSECVSWSYDGNALDLHHINAMLNCCLDSLGASVEMRGDTITIIEHEYTPMCDCNCPYDLDLRITNIVPGLYHFAVRYGPFDEGIPKIAWSADLTIAPTGTYCNNLCCGPD